MKIIDQDEFVFDRILADYKGRQFVFNYKVNHANKIYNFTEKLNLPAVDINELPQYQKVGINNILNSLSLLIGISYWKLFCPPKITTPYIKLTEKQADFWNTLYKKGLGEFFYKNNIDFRHLIHFPFISKTEHSLGQFTVSNSALLLFGGGKDSIVSGEILKKYKKNFTLFSVGNYEIQNNIANIMKKNIIFVTRVIDPALFELVKENKVFSGHVPMTSIYSLLGLFTASLLGYSHVIASSEESSSIGNINYLHSQVNHQWSKSYEFEILFQKYIEDAIGNGITYFSLLRPILEIEIVKLFCQYPQYFSAFSSCNRNFRINQTKYELLWCGKCAKCIFVFLLLAAFLSKSTVTKIFSKNIFNDVSLLTLYREILGLSGFKPFECIGTPEEAQWAFFQVIKKGEFKESMLLQQLNSELIKKRIQVVDQKDLFRVSKIHQIPSSYLDILKSL